MRSTGACSLIFVVACSIGLAEGVHSVTPSDECPVYPDHSKLLVVRDKQATERPIKTPEDWGIRRRHILCGMQRAMGKLPDRSSLPPLDMQVTDEHEGEGFRRLTISFAAEGTDRIPAYLYLPSGRPKEYRSAAMLALHPTSTLGKGVVAGEGTGTNRNYGLELAKCGYIVLCPDYPSFGDYKYDFAADEYVSGTMKGIFNHMRCVDLLASRDDVDPDRIGVIGHSLGGHNAMFVGAFDQRLKVIVSSCGWTPFHDYYGGNIKGWTSDRYMPRLAEEYKLDPDRVPFDFYEVVAALAPRAFFSCSPLKDDNFAVEGVKKASAAAAEVYALLGAPDALQVRYPDCGHDFPEPVRAEAYAFIDKALKHSASGGDDLGAELPRIPPHDPAEALSTFATLPGFRMEQVAAEPLVRDPVAMSFDADGRLFVVEMCDYSEQADDHLGTVRLLEDTDEDGRFDKSTIYVEGLSWPTAVIAYDGGIFIGAAPDILYCKDTDGDGRADIRKVVFTGFGRSNVQGLLNSFQWGLDNRVHGATSSSGGNVRRADVEGSPTIALNGRDFSFDPRRLDLRPESGGAQHGLSFDDWGRKFVSSNSDHLQMILFEDRYAARTPDVAAPSPRKSIAADGPQAEVFRTSPVEPWRVVRTRLRVSGAVPGPVEGGGRAAGYFTGATGATIYRGHAWPKEFHGNAFIGDVGSNIIHRKRLEPDGVGLIAKRADEGREFISSTDIWFRPAQFANAPDGNLYVADVYREVIEHPASLPPQIKKHLDLTNGRDRGRIYRIVHEGFQQPKLPRLQNATLPDLVAALEHQNGWHRDTCARLLFERQDRTAVEPLRSVARLSKSPLGRMHALYALKGIDALSAEDVLRALEDSEPRVREHAIRLAEPLLEDSEELRARLVNIADDADIGVRLQLAFTLGFIQDSGRSNALAKIAAHDPENAWIRFAVVSSCAGSALEVMEKFPRETLARSKAAREFATQLARTIAMRGSEQELIRASEIGLYHPSEPSDHRALINLAILRGLNQGVAKRSSKSPETAQVSLLLREKTAACITDAKKIAMDSQTPEDIRREAIDGFAMPTAELAAMVFDQASSTAELLLDGEYSVAVQTSAISMLGNFRDPAVAELLIDRWPRLSPQLRSAASEVLFSRLEWTVATLDAVENDQIAMADLELTRLKQLESSPNQEIQRRAKTLLASLSTKPRQDLVDAYQSALQLTGDSVRGKALFVQHCAACHRVADTGHEIGPNLAAMAARGPEAILTNVLDPNREANPQYVNYLVRTVDGRTLTGIVAAETASSITLRRAENASDTILRSDIEEIRSSGVSIMPEGFEKQLDPQAMADLIAYLISSVAKK